MMIFDREADEVAKEMIDEFQREYMINGWELISGTTKIFTLLSFVGVLLFVSPENSFYGTAIYCSPILFGFWNFVDKVIDSSEYIRNIMFYIMLI